jgi:hypothetical protein
MGDIHLTHRQRHRLHTQHHAVLLAFTTHILKQPLQGTGFESFISCERLHLCCTDQAKLAIGTGPIRSLTKILWHDVSAQTVKYVKVASPAKEFLPTIC